jgi:hypothetical protein
MGNVRGDFVREEVAMRRYLLPLAALGIIAVSLSACVVYDHPGRGWCYFHPYRC